MQKIISGIIVLVVLSSFSGAPKTDPLLSQKDAKFTYSRFDASGRLTGYVNVEIQAVRSFLNTRVSVAKAEYMNDYRVLYGTTRQYFSSDSAGLYVDARQWIPDLTKAPENNLPDNGLTWLYYPFQLQTGDTLPDAAFNTTLQGPDGISRTFYKIIHRKAGAVDTLDLGSIGKIAARKITCEIIAARPDQPGANPYRYASVEEWFVPRLGIVQHIRNGGQGNYYKLELRGYKAP